MGEQKEARGNERRIKRGQDRKREQRVVEGRREGRQGKKSGERN